MTPTAHDRLRARLAVCARTVELRARLRRLISEAVAASRELLRRSQEASRPLARLLGEAPA